MGPSAQLLEGQRLKGAALGEMGWAEVNLWAWAKAQEVGGCAICVCASEFGDPVNARAEFLSGEAHLGLD